MAENNFQSLLDELVTLQNELAVLAPNSLEYLDIELMALKVAEKIEISGFDPLADLPSVVVPDFAKLRELSGELKKAIHDEEHRVALLGKIIGVAKTVVTGAGIPLPI